MPSRQRRFLNLLLTALAAAASPGAAQAVPTPLNVFRPLVRTATWVEKWPGRDGQLEARQVTGELWTEAIQAALDRHGSVRIPARDRPYYLDAPIVLRSGQSLYADPAAEIRLKPGTGTCMVRNERLAGSANAPVPAGLEPDTDLLVEGGIWTTLATAPAETNGNARGASAKAQSVTGTHGVILLQNVRRATVRNVTVRQSKTFAVHLANIRDFTVENVTLEAHGRDGVHVNGPASDGLIRGVRGDSHDDNVALNAWEWQNYASSYGPIERIVIEDVTGAPEAPRAANSIRLLPGVKRFADGRTLDCPVRDVTLRRITDIREFKLYDQPNLELGRDRDFSAGLGRLHNIRFENLVFRHPGRIEVHADTDGLVIHDVRLDHALAPGWHLLAIGPKSATYRGGGDPAHWREIFSPDLDCTVRGVAITGVRRRGAPADLPVDRIVRVIEQRPNPDYPNTTPKGGRGRGIWIR